MSFVLRLEIRRSNFGSEPRLPLDMEAVVRVLDQEADRELDGSLSARVPAKNGINVLLGWINAVPILFDKRGFLYTHIGWRQTDRLFKFLGRLVKEMGCEVYAPDAGEFWTETVSNG
jgi:hypothetical protein